MILNPILLYRIILVCVALAYAVVISTHIYHLPSAELLSFIVGYVLLTLAPLVWGIIRAASNWFESREGTALLQFTFGVDAVFLLVLAYAAGEGNDLWATFFIPWGMTLILSGRTSISVQLLDTVLGVVLAAMIVLTVWLTISPAATSPVANALVLWGAFLEGWVILRCVAKERIEWGRRMREDTGELEPFRRLTEAISSGLVLIEDGVVVTATGPSKDLLRIEPGQRLTESGLPAETVRKLEEAVAGDEMPIDLECPITTREGRSLYVGISAYRVPRGKPGAFGLVLEGRKISVRREERLRRSNRLASVGQLAAGIAHELGNPIAIIKSCSAYLVNRCHKEDPQLEELEIIQCEASRCENLLSRLKSLASGREEAKRVDMRSVVQEAVSLVRYQVKETALALSLPREPVYLFADQSQMVAILVNLLLNAAQSMEGRPKESGIAVALQTGQEEAVLRVSDHGRGMTREEQERIFDPFYTGRPNGTGLGLSIVQQVIEQLGGTITVESVLDQGTTFTITLPLTDED